MHTIETRNPENLFGLWSGESLFPSSRVLPACRRLHVKYTSADPRPLQSFQSAVLPWKMGNVMRISCVPPSPPALCQSANHRFKGLEIVVP
jgi:hypothetical protein